MSKTRGANRGFALMIVIVVMLLVTFLASELLLRIRFESRVAFNRRQQQQARFLAESGIGLALFRLLDRAGDDTLGDQSKPFLYGHGYEAVLPAGKIRYYAINESGKIGLNSSNLAPLKAYLNYLGLDEDRVAVIVDSLMDWRDADDLHRLNGAETDYYQALADPYIPRNGPLQDPGEFLMIRGTEGLDEIFDPAAVFSVHNSSGKINVNSLSPALVDFITGGDEEKAKLYRETRAGNGALNGLFMTQILGVDRFTTLRSSLTYLAGGNPYFTLVAYGEPATAGADEKNKGGRAIGVRALIYRGGANGYEYRSWQEIRRRLFPGNPVKNGRK